MGGQQQKRSHNKRRKDTDKNENERGEGCCALPVAAEVVGCTAIALCFVISLVEGAGSV